MSAQTGASFDAGLTTVNALNNALGFIIALAVNNAFQKTFELIPVGKGLLGAWLYAIVALGICILLMWIIASYLAPAIEHKPA